MKYSNMKKIIIHLCADTWSDTKPYKDRWYTVIRVGSDIGVENYHPPEWVYGIIANPVCLEFSGESDKIDDNFILVEYDYSNPF